MSQKKTIIIVDDHALFREGIKSILEKEPGYSVVGEAGNAMEGVKILRELKPDLALIDLSLPDKSGYQLIDTVKVDSPKTRMLVVSVYSEASYVVRAFKKGIAGYITKNSACDKLLNGIKTVLDGDYYADSAALKGLVEGLSVAIDENFVVTDPKYNSLSRREQEIMLLLAEGLSKEKIAEKLYISSKTVGNHLYKIITKLGLSSPSELVIYASNLGLVEAPMG